MPESGSQLEQNKCLPAPAKGSFYHVVLLGPAAGVEASRVRSLSSSPPSSWVHHSFHPSLPSREPPQKGCPSRCDNIAVQGVVPFWTGRPLMILANRFRENTGVPHTAARGRRAGHTLGSSLPFARAAIAHHPLLGISVSFHFLASTAPFSNCTPSFLWGPLFPHFLSL